MKGKFYRISTISRITNTDQSIIIRYEKEGLVEPRIVGEERLYTPDDLERIKMIRRLTDELGVNLAGVDVILNMREQMVRMQKEFEDIISDIRRGLFRELKEFETRAKRPLIESSAGKGTKIRIED